MFASIGGWPGLACLMAKDEDLDFTIAPVP